MRARIALAATALLFGTNQAANGADEPLQLEALHLHLGAGESIKDRAVLPL